MEIGFYDLDDDDLEVGNQENQEPSVNPSPEGEDTFIQDYLKTKGIDDIEKIKFEDDNGNIEEKSWANLTKEEKINILNTPLEVSEQVVQNNNNDLSDDEINLINNIRQSNLSPNDYIASLQTSNIQEPIYKIDDLSDDELYLLDLESRVGELDDDEAAQALSVAKQNEEFYKKQVDGIRKEYKEREDFQSQQDQAAYEQQQREAFENYQYNISNAIDNFNSVGNLDLNFEDNDKEELAEFILSQDEQGNNYLYQALQDPQTLVKAAWFILNGDEAFETITDYFKKQMKQVSEHQYQKGLEDGKKGVQSKPTVVIDNSNKNNNRHKVYSDINDLDDDD